MPDAHVAIPPRSPVVSGAPRTRSRRWLRWVVGVVLVAVLGWQLEIWQGIWLARTAYHQQTWAGRLRAAQAELERLKQENARLKGEAMPGEADTHVPKEGGR